MIYIIHDDCGQNKLKFMYDPFVKTSFKYIKDTYNDECIFLHNNYNIDLMNKGDKLILIGSMKSVDSECLKKKGIYTILYWTEPKIVTSYANEVWLYSKNLFNNFKKINLSQKIKFIPIICQVGVPKINYKLNNKFKLLFIGNLKVRSKKVRCSLNKLSYFKELANLWNDDDYNNIITSNSNIFYSCNKNTSLNVLPSCRINKLLSHGCIVISQLCNETDMKLYKGLVYFCDFNKINNLFKSFLRKSKDELSILSNKIYRKFETKFYTRYKNLVCER